MGRPDFEQDEDCLTLNIWAPPYGDGPHPVLFWIHGGGFVTGGGSWPFYRGAQLARSGRLVVVTINYRLGALGYVDVSKLSGDEPGAANRGLLDQIAALRWVHENIREFGGDPEAITVAGQSAGGAAVLAMMGHGSARRLFKRAILQSPVAGPPTSKDDAAAICDELVRTLGITGCPTAADLWAVSTDRFIEAQTATVKKFSRFGAPLAAIQQVRDGTIINGDLIQKACEAASSGIAVLAGTTRDEMDAFLMQEQTRCCNGTEALRLLSTAALPQFCDSVFDRYSNALPLHSPARVASALMTDRHFRIPTVEFVNAWSAAGGSAYLYRFDWTPNADSPYGACHCIDIPVALNNLEDWRSCPSQPSMLEGCDRASFDAISRSFQGAWVEFARSGRPQYPGLPSWPRYTASHPCSMQFDAQTRLAANSDTYISELWKSGND
jgi:para-nitrobenzyl esterase